MVSSSIEKLQGTPSLQPSCPAFLKNWRTTTRCLRAAYSGALGKKCAGRNKGYSANEALSNMDPKARAKYMSGLSDEERFMLTGTPSGQENAITYEQLKGFRSEIGKQMRNPALEGDVRSALSDLYYNKFSTKMRDMAKAEGKEAEYNGANATFKKFMDAFHDTRAIKNSGSPIAHSLRASAYITDPLTGTAADRAASMLGEYRHLGAKPELYTLLRDKLAQAKELAKLSNGYKIPKGRATEFHGMGEAARNTGASHAYLERFGA
jgi:hypothetical protein